MIRCIITLIFVFLFLFLSLPILLVEWIIGKFNPALKDASCDWFVKLAFKVIVGCTGSKITAIGTENIPPKGTGAVYIGNHRSYFDVIITYLYMPTVTCFIAKKEMNKVPSLRIWMRNIHCLFLDRDDIKQGMKVILDAIQLVKDGISVVIFPEGTRNKVNDTFLPFKGGSFKVATKSGCDIIPLSIVNSAAIYEDHKPKICKSHVIIEFGKPIRTSELSKEEQKALPDTVRDIVIETYYKNKALL